MGKKRTLDSITPDFRFTDEEIEKLKRDMNDPAALQKSWEQMEQESEQILNDLKTMCETGKMPDGTNIPGNMLYRMKKDYNNMLNNKRGKSNE